MGRRFAADGDGHGVNGLFAVAGRDDQLTAPRLLSATVRIALAAGWCTAAQGCPGRAPGTVAVIAVSLQLVIIAGTPPMVTLDGYCRPCWSHSARYTETQSHSGG